MNRLEKESLKKAVPFEQLREIRLAAFKLTSQDVHTAFQAADSLSRIATISNCEIMIEHNVVTSAIQFINTCVSDSHLCTACDLLLAMFCHELELVQEITLAASGMQVLESARIRFPDSTTKVVQTLQQCVLFFNAGQNIARETGVLKCMLELNRNFPDMYDTHSCINSMCHLNYQSSLVAEVYGFDMKYKIAPSIQLKEDIPEGQPSSRTESCATSQDFSKKYQSSSRATSIHNNAEESLPYAIGAQIRAIQSLKESFATDKSGSITSISNGSSALLKKSLLRSHVSPNLIRNPLLNDAQSNLHDVASRILGSRHFMDVIKRADKIIKTDIPETKTDQLFGKNHFCFKTQGVISEDVWACVPYVHHIPTGSLGTKYGQHEVSFLKWFYAGQMTGDDAHGNGMFRWVNGSKYAGQIHKNKRHGLGKMDFDTADTTMASDLCTSSGTSYIGHWDNDKIHGIGMFQFHRDDGGGSLCGIFVQGKLTPFCFTEDILPENFIETIRIEERKASALSAEAIQNTSASIFRHNYDSNDGQFLFPLHYTPQRALIQRLGVRGEETTNVSNSRF
jgi:hypothetical protein